jgi:glycosyltransferase involved in cell wall biosynthesis
MEGRMTMPAQGSTHAPTTAPVGGSARRWRLGVDVRRLLGVRTGVARVVHSILTEWQRLPMPFDEVRLLSPRPLPPGLLPPHPKFRSVVVGPNVPGLLWEQVVLPARVRDLDVLLAPSDTMPVLAPWKRVVMMYAYSPEMAASFSWSARIRWEPFARNAARRGDAIIVSSRNILETLELGLGVEVPRERVHFAPLAADTRFHPRDPADPELRAALQRYGVADAPYVLFVGKLSRRRHIPELLQAFREISAEVPHRLLLAGPNLLHLDVEGLIAELGLEGRVLYHGFVPDADVPLLYAGAGLFVLASEGEGFSLTTLEAMQSGVPVITLDRPNMVEVTEGAAYLVPDGRTETLTGAMRAVLGNATLHSDLRHRGLARTRVLTWSHTAQQSLDVLWAIASGSQR